jgi:magnesium-transporting ATPase (P-type)
VGAAATAAYLAGRALEPDAAQTMAFATLALSELALVFSIRAGDASFRSPPRNPLLLAAVAGSLLVLALVVYLPALHEAFGTVSLGPAAAAVVLALALAPAVAAEAAKAVRRRG